jgi:iron complex outermembrane receptor protein
LQDAKQDEAGIHLKFLDGRGTASVAYYNIAQNNFSIFNPGNLAVPPPNPALPALYSNRTARGWEYETNFSVTKEFSIIANYTYFRNRDAFDVPFRGTAENSGALWAHYSFDTGRLKGLGIGVGETHLAKRPGDTATGVTKASTPTDVIPVQPSFYLPAYSLTDLTISYVYDKHWTQRVYVDNVFDTKYLAAALTRYSVYPGLGTNVRASITYSF